MVLAPVLKNATHTDDDKTFGNPYFGTSEVDKTTIGQQSAGRVVPLTTEEKSVTIRVDLSKVYDGSNSGYSQSVDANTFSSGLVILLAGITSGESYYIKSISMKEVDD